MSKCSRVPSTLSVAKYSYCHFRCFEVRNSTRSIGIGTKLCTQKKLHRIYKVGTSTNRYAMTYGLISHFNSLILSTTSEVKQSFNILSEKDSLIELTKDCIANPTMVFASVHHKHNGILQLMNDGGYIAHESQFRKILA